LNFLHFIADYRQPVLDVLFQSATYIAQETLVIGIICWLFWCGNKKLAYTLGFTYFISGLLIQELKITFRIPRPWVLDPDFSAVPSALPGATGYSFPSGHTQSSTALFSTLGFAAKKKPLRYLCFFMIALIGFSRMYLGVHTPKDVLVSMGLTLIVSILVYYVFSKRFFTPSSNFLISLILFAACAVGTTYAAFLYANGTVDAKMGQDALKACGAGFGFAAGYYLEQRFVRFDMPKSVKGKILRFVAGILSLALLLVIFTFTIKRFLIGNIISYGLLVIWIVAVYPAIFSYVTYKKTH
jgi:membrane-associated phospholipid phosphatase